MTVALASLRSHWFVACTSAALGRRPLARTVLGVPIVLFRAERNAAALLDRCPHRNAPLSAGRVAEGLLHCPYHGWAFDGTGKCRRVPGLSENHAFADRYAEVVPVAEHDGLVWINLGGKTVAPPTLPLRRYRTLDDPRYDSFLWASSLPCAFVDAIENLLDAAHPHFVHAGLVRWAHRRRAVTVRIRRDADMAEATYAEDGDPAGLIARLFEGKRAASIGRYFPPTTAQLEYVGPLGSNFVFTVMFTPVDSKNTLAHAVLSTPRRRAPAFVKKLLLRIVLGQVLRQDWQILDRQRMNIDRFGGADFASTPLDVMRPHILYFLDHLAETNVCPFEGTVTMEL